jgi:hypothetical protein
MKIRLPHNQIPNNKSLIPTFAATTNRAIDLMET